MEYYSLLAVLTFAAFSDARNNRIPNGLCLAAFIFAVLLRGCQGGIRTLLLLILWAGILFAVLFPFWALGIVGAGDVKIIIVSGVFLGKDTIQFLLCAGGCTALLSLLLMINRRNFFRRMKVFLTYMGECFVAGKLLPYPFDRNKEKEDGGILVSYGLLAGHFLALATGLYGRT